MTPAPAPVSTHRSGGASSGVPVCSDSQLAAAFAGIGAASGHDYSRIVLTNRSSADCTVAGYPGVAFQDARHHPYRLPVGRVPRRSAAEPTSPVPVTLEPGGSASAYFVFGTDGNPAPGQATCPPGAAFIEITAPGGVAAHEFSYSTMACPHVDASVAPLVAGANSSP